jgi:phosphonate transport system substrate-binding protein
MMIKRLSKVFVISAFLVYWFVVAAYADTAKKSITMAIFPCADVVMAFEKFHPLVTYLKQETGLDIRLVVLMDTAEFGRAMKNGDIDFALQSAQMYVRFADSYEKGTLLRTLTREGHRTKSGVVIVKKDSGIESIADLRGKSVKFGPKFSAARWVFAKLLFEESGLDIDQDLKTYSHGGCCEDVSFSVQLASVDGGVICDHFLKEHFGRQHELGVDSKQLVVIGRTALVPTRVFCPRRDVSSDIVNKVSQALLRLDKQVPEHEKILYHAELGGFQKANDEDYDQLRMRLDIKIGH